MNTVAYDTKHFENGQQTIIEGLLKPISGAKWNIFTVDLWAN